MSDSLLIVGPDSGVGAILLRAAPGLGWGATLASTADAWPRNATVQRVYQRLWASEPMHLRRFSRQTVALARRERPRHCITVGAAPVDRRALEALRAMGIRTANFSTDDPWNDRIRAFRWQRSCLSHYDLIFTPRRENLDDFGRAGCERVQWLPFAYDPALHFPASPQELADESRTADVVFIGGADEERLPYARALVAAGLDLRLYGGYWERHADLRPLHGGVLRPAEMRRVLGRAKMSFCLVRRANRDGHVMRTYEEPAMGGCVAMEDTEEHRALFPDPALEPCFFRTPDELAARATALCADPSLRARIAAAQHRTVTGAANTYGDRLRDMLDALDALG